MAWHLVEQDSFVDGWHIKAICQALEALYYDRIESNNLVMNIPPRHMKSLLVDVFFPAWVWTKAPSKKFLCLSYAESTIAEITGKTRKLVGSAWYQEHFNVPLASKPDTTTKFANVHGGYVYSFGFGGAVTGGGADFIVVDDPLKSTDASSDPVRNKVNEDYDDAIANRLNDPMTGKRIIIMQRLHERDLVGHLIFKKMKFEHIVFPFEYEGTRFTSTIGIEDLRTTVGDVLWKGRWTSLEKLNEYKKQYFGARAIAGQLQQRPSPEGGYIFKRDWFLRLPENDSVSGVYLSFDTAGSLLGAYSSGVVGELRADYTLYIKNAERKQVEFPQLQSWIEEMAKRYQNKLKAVIIENKSSGIQAVQTLRQQSPQWLAEKIVSFNPVGSKEARQFQAATFCEKGCVYLPEPSTTRPWLPDFEEEIFTVPSSPYKDQADAFSQMVWYLRMFLNQGWQARTNNTPVPIKLTGVF